MTKQDILLMIVQGWDINPTPEYRGFRCANCQTYINEAWHHIVTSGGFFLPIHLCDLCEEKFRADEITPTNKGKQTVTSKTFNKDYSEHAVMQFAHIISQWHVTDVSIRKAFTCDACGNELHCEIIDGRNLRVGYHVWWRRHDQILCELHFHKSCGDRLMSH